MKVKLIEREKDREHAWYRTADGRYDVLGEDLHLNTAFDRSHGAGPVWIWRPAKDDRYWSGTGYRAFGLKATCLADLERHIAESAPPTVTPATVIVTCGACAQKNNVIIGVASRCGRCKAPIAATARTGDARLDDFADRLNNASNAQSFGRMHFPQDYVSCATCGASTHKRDRHHCAAANTERTSGS